MPSAMRSFLGVFVGFMVMILAKVIFTPIFVHTAGQPSAHPTAGYLAANALISFAEVALGGFAAAFVSQENPFASAAAFGVLMFTIGVLSYLHYAGAQPHWYQLLMQGGPPLCALGGAALYVNTTRSVGT